MNAAMNRMHNHWHLDWDGDGVADTVTSSQEGVHLIQHAGIIKASIGSTHRWTTKKLGNGAAGEKPEAMGAGEIKVGKLKNGPRFIVTVRGLGYKFEP